MEILDNSKLNIEKLSNTLILGSTGSGKSVMCENIINYCISKNYNICLVDPKQIEYFEYESYLNLSYKICNNKIDYDNLASFIENYNSTEKLYVFIDELAEVVNESKRLVEAIKLKKNNICVIACCQNPYILTDDLIDSFDYEIVLRLLDKLEGSLETKTSTKEFKTGEFIIKNITTSEETNKINNLEIK